MAPVYAGSHISIRRGYLEAARTALAIGASAFQYFPKNPRSLTVKSFNREDAEACAAYCREHGLRSISHTSYPTNLAVGDPGLLEATVHSLRNDLEITEACGSVGVVVHFGKSRDPDPLRAYRNILACLDRVLDGWKGQAKLLLENQAGEGHRMGMTLVELTQIRSLAARPEHIGFCLDTCHLFASGVWDGRNWRDIEREGEERGYWAHLEAVHFNDSVYGSGEHRDRHAPVGKGKIGREAMTGVVTSPLLAGKLFILETGTGPDGTHREEIALVKEMAGSA